MSEIDLSRYEVIMTDGALNHVRTPEGRFLYTGQSMVAEMNRLATEVASLREQLEAARELDVVHDEYEALLGKSESQLAGVALIHGFTVDDELVQKGIQLRERIRALREDHDE